MTDENPAVVAYVDDLLKLFHVYVEQMEYDDILGALVAHMYAIATEVGYRHDEIEEQMTLFLELCRQARDPLLTVIDTGDDHGA